MGSKPRKIKNGKEALMEIGRLEDNFCKGCEIKDNLRREGLPYHDIQNFCMFECKTGKRIRALGGIIEYGVEVNNHFKAPDLTKERYIELREKISDKEIRGKFEISRITLTRRKQSWGLTKIREYVIPSLVLKDMTKEKLEELSRDHTDKEIAKMYSVSKITIQKRRKEWEISKDDRFLRVQFSLDEYKYLSEKKGLKDREICELWEISASSLLNLKKVWNIYKPRKIPKPDEIEAMGLTRERMLELVPEKTDKEIADLYGLYERTVTKYRKKLGISATLRLPKNRIKPDDIKPLIDRGLSLGDMGEALGIHKTTVSEIIKQFKEKNLL